MSSDISRARKLGLRMPVDKAHGMRSLNRSDYDALLSILQSSPEATWERSAASPSYVSSLMDFRLQHYAKYGFGVLAVESSEEGRLVGQAGVQVLDDERDMIEVVIFLDAMHTAKGLGTEVLRAIVKAGQRCGIRSLYAAIRLENAGAQRFFSRHRFELIGQEVHFGQTCGIWVRRLEST